MTEYTTRALFVPAAIVDNVRGLCIAQAGFDAADRMFRTGLVPIGSAPGTEPIWYVTDGYVATDFAPALDDPAVMFAECEKKGIPVSLAQCEAILSACIVAPGGTAWAVMAERGWQLATSEESNA